MPSFHPVNGERSELSTMEGRTMAMGKFAALLAPEIDSPRLFVNVYVFGQPRCCARLQADSHQPVARPAQRGCASIRHPALSRAPLGRIAASPSACRRRAFESSGLFARLFDAPDHFAQRSNFLFGVESRGSRRRIVIVVQFFHHAAVAHSHNVASGKMHQAGVIDCRKKSKR